MRRLIIFFSWYQSHHSSWALQNDWKDKLNRMTSFMPISKKSMPARSTTRSPALHSGSLTAGYTSRMSLRHGMTCIMI